MGNNSNTTTDVAKILAQQWDYVVIGTGMGGGTIGYKLAAAGFKVLFIERGLSRLNSGANSNLILGHFPESHPDFKIPERRKELLARGLRCTQEVTEVLKDREIQFTPLIGEGTGGSSGIYGAAMERFFPEDFQPSSYLSKYPGTNAQDWPLQYGDLEAYYEQAEELYNVYGSSDPLRASYQSKKLKTRKLSPAGRRLFDHWQSKNLHPYLLPVGHPPHTESSCQGCQGTLCTCSAKMGSLEACINKAVNEYGATCWSECEVTRLEATENRIELLHLKYQGHEYTLKPNTVILSAGALFSPALLLNSKSSLHPRGIGNSSGLVGKNLCRHFFDLAMVSIDPLKDKGYFEKELALNDFYHFEGQKLGTVQSLGNPPEFASAAYEMNLEKDKKGFLYGLFLSFFKHFGKYFFDKAMNSKVSLAVIMEDFPYEDNRIEVDSEGKIRIHYQMRPEAHERLALFRSLVKKSLRPFGVQLHKQGENNQRLAHTSGTCRMGLNSKQSVVDVNCRSHDIANLYIVDSSFFPSSSGINPSLTIAANALRVADHLIKFSRG